MADTNPVGLYLCGQSTANCLTCLVFLVLTFFQFVTLIACVVKLCLQYRFHSELATAVKGTFLMMAFMLLWQFGRIAQLSQVFYIKQRDWQERSCGGIIVQDVPSLLMLILVAVYEDLMIGLLLVSMKNDWKMKKWYTIGIVTAIVGSWVLSVSLECATHETSVSFHWIILGFCVLMWPLNFYLVIRLR